ncbi:DNA cross-link repair 1A protein isoform X1 [Phyllopteryx taeniolatus]|uniref:DNA cross-link repair 1A protein isoform X1 n=1 Tax=Phyllopteryx taeniolatus TaxID=161469 RepID=UPI002AD4BC07|nr:DNA cross-link repair 1A protein isoform X1 [Phyllopteryx taeniolatus]
MSQKADSESDIWDYKPPVKKKKKRESSSACRNVSRRRCTTERKSCNTLDSTTTPSDVSAGVHNGQCDPTSSSRSKETQNVDNEAKEDFCPICQMPFSILLVQSQRWHVAECLDTPRDTCQECPHGPQCSSSIPNHYKKFNHTQLAHTRANGHSVPFDFQDSEPRTPTRDASGDNVGMTPSPPPSQATNGLLLLRSPDPDDMKKKKGWSPRGRSSFTSSQGSSTETVATCDVLADPHDEELISYSPLSEFPAEMDGVRRDASENEDSVVLFSEDEPPTGFTDTLEGTGRVDDISSAVGEKLQSPQRTVLERLKETLQASPVGSSENSAAPPRKAQREAGRGSGLKQTDIGVFFGLKPLKAQEKEEASGRKWKTNAAEDADRPGEGESPGGSKVEVASGQTKHRRHKWWNSENNSGEEQPRRCPFYKKIPGTTFAIDAFRYGAIEGVTAYFLTHFHSDHYGGLTTKSTLPIYCNKITGNLVKSKLKVAEQHVHILPMNTRVSVDGAQVVLLDANHCPGAAMLLIFLPNGQTVLHTGDFRADPSMEAYPELLGCRVHTLYLDTTYCGPEYTFPRQQEVINFAASTAFESVTLHPRTLVVCGSYSVGKEKVFLALAEVLGSKVCLSRDKYNTMCCLESEHIKRHLTTDWKAARVHVLPMMQLNVRKLQQHLGKFSSQYDLLLAFKPTGWTFSQQTASMEDIQPVVSGNVSIYGIPYSEHSSFLELKRFVQWLRPLKIIPTVNNGSWAVRKAMEKHFSEWIGGNSLV